MSFVTFTDYHESDEIYSGKPGKLFIKIRYPDHTYHEIKYVQKVSLDSFWASTGGFIGMFLGYSVLQLPHFFSEMIIWGIKRQNGNKISVSTNKEF